MKTLFLLLLVNCSLLFSQDNFIRGIYMFGNFNVDFEQLHDSLHLTHAQAWIDYHTGVPILNVLQNSGNLEIIGQSGKGGVDSSIYFLSSAQRMVFEAEQEIDLTRLRNYFGERNGDIEDTLLRSPSSPSYMIKSPVPDNEYHYNRTNYRASFILKRASAQDPEVLVCSLAVVCKDNGTVLIERILKVGDLSTDLETITLDFPITYDPPPPSQKPYGVLTGEQEVSQLTCTGIDIRVYWYGNVTTWLDKVIIEDDWGKRLFSGQHDSFILSTVLGYKNSYPLLKRYYFYDEPSLSSFLGYNYVNKKILSVYGADTTNGKGHALTTINGFSNFDRFFLDSQPRDLLINPYSIWAYIPTPVMTNQEAQSVGIALYTTDAAYNELLQDEVQEFYIAPILSAAEKTKQTGRNLFITPQLHGEYFENNGKFHKPSGEIRYRPPTGNEVTLQCNLAIAYGSKGLIPYPLGTDEVFWPGEGNAVFAGLLTSDTDNGIHKNHWTNYGIFNSPSGLKSIKMGYSDKWDALAGFNNKLMNMSSEIMSIAWRNSYSLHLGQPAGEYITNVQSYFLPYAEMLWQPDAPSSTYIELGLFKKTGELQNPNLEYFYVVNRRTLDLEGRKIRVDINKTSSSYQNWSIKEVGTSNEWTIAPEGYFETFYQSGEGKLFKLEPVILGGGTMNFNETLPSGTSINVKGTVIIAQNKTLTISSNSTLNVLNNSRLIVNGNLIAVGTLQNKVTFDFTTPVQNGIVINNGGTVSLNHTIIKNAHTAIAASGSNAFSVQNSTINNCVYGIDLLNYSQGTTPLIKGNNFGVNETAVSANYGNTIVIQGNTITNSTMGVYLNQTSNGNVLNNNIISNMETQPGVMFSSSYGAIRGNQISGHGNGIALIESSPKVGVNNIHHNRFHGIYSGYGSSADLLAELIRDPCSEVPLIYPVGGFNSIYENGSEAEIRRGDDDGSEIYLNTSSIQASYGCNEIYDDREETQTLPTELLMNGTYGSEEFVIYAEGNYWGENNSLLSSRFGNLLVEYEPFNLYSCPLPELEQYCPIIMHTADGVVLDTLYALKTEAMMDEKSQLYSEAGKAYYTNDQITAKEKYALIINNYGTEKDAINAYWRLYKLQQESNGSIHSFRELVNNKKALTNDSVLIWTMNNLLGISLTQIEAYTEAISYYEENIQTNPESDISLNSELNIMTLSLLNGISGLGKIATSYGVSNREEYISRRKELLEKKFGKSDNQITGEQIPTEYALFQNYPNPFNPFTTITYQIPKEGLVTLKIYDILGREVTTLVNEEKENGKYSVEFNASKLSSGVYLYELCSNEYKSTKKLLLMK